MTAAALQRNQRCTAAACREHELATTADHDFLCKELYYRRQRWHYRMSHDTSESRNKVRKSAPMIFWSRFALSPSDPVRLGYVFSGFRNLSHRVIKHLPAKFWDGARNSKNPSSAPPLLPFLHRHHDALHSYGHSQAHIILNTPRILGLIGRIYYLIRAQAGNTQSMYRKLIK